MTGSAAIRSLRINELCRLAHSLKKKGVKPDDIYKQIKYRAYGMAERHTAEQYLKEVVRRVSK